jgi:hypothetical protein
MRDTLVDRREVLEVMFDLTGKGWLNAPDIQRAFTKLFDDIHYKEAMDDLRLWWFIEHEYFDDPANGKKYWRYRRTSSPPNAGGR